MNITITNRGAVAVPFSSSNGNGFAVALEPGEPFTVADDSIVVASAGDNPTFREELEQAAKAVYEMLVGLITFWRSHNVDDDTPAIVLVQIDNDGDNALRVILGSNVNDVEVGPGAIYVAEAPEYVEIRELGV